MQIQNFHKCQRKSVNHTYSILFSKESIKFPQYDLLLTKSIVARFYIPQKIKKINDDNDMSTKNKGDYEPIPDLEEGDVTLEENSKSKLTPEERYPNASSKEEASLLASIDDIIENIIPTVNPPLLPVGKEGISDLNGFFALLKVPFFTFASLVVGAIIVIALDSPIAKALYPYVAAVASFVASLPALRKSFEDASENLVGTIETKIKGLFDTVDDFANTGVSLVQDVSDKMDAMFQTIKPTLDLAGKMEKQLKKIDPNIDIPVSIFEIFIYLFFDFDLIFMSIIV